MPHEWTAEHLYETVNGWPKEAWPDVKYRPGESRNNYHGKWVCGDGRITPAIAVLLFTASGLEWLLKLPKGCGRRCLSLAHLASGYMADSDMVPMSIRMRRPQEGPTLLHAISEAIKHTQGKD